ncbi:maleylpyruvate isomerase family mycothiol-dependent enzyme [Streptomyces sp. HNM0574]|uniref:maleylpyruvate isomerase family mycothiol-dependent enzyme n=1 Tax=Streptomyces sp. HNM0574 TaxID=2714954 RepID=UPI00146EA97C|nr:maleylpyruvate isomerase family mycothiol-dependent enzyme [Streptomyces sp. HNM0574]NLU66119.1 maleylpyruvate isomerase family mycothiol-dependent enzyme [Streptomyces sp. HNM0574]
MSERDPRLPGRLLLSERDTLLPLLRRLPEPAFALRTACPGWCVREVLAHCGAALVRIVEGRTEGAFGPEANAGDVAERARWPLGRVLDELERGLGEAGEVIAAADGRLDVIGLGEWVHAGDVRDALGEPGAYQGPGTGEALSLLQTVSRERGTPRVHVRLPDAPGELRFGNPVPGRPPARLESDAPTLVRLYTGRPLVGTRYRLHGAEERELVVYG